MDTTFILEKSKPVKVEEIDASFNLQTCGRIYLPSGERTYCGINVTCKNTQFYLDNKQPLFWEIYQASVIAINPWGTESYGLPAGSCKVEVRISPAVNFVRQYNWEVETIVNEQSFSFPETFTGIPWLHYAAATKQINFDLETLHGKTVRLQKIKLKEKGKRSGENVSAHIVIIDGKAITGWLSSPVLAPGIAPLNMEKSKLTNW